MNKDDIRQALGKIQPREELVSDTIKKAYELKYSKKETPFSAFSCNFKLATTMCALALVLCIGVFAGINGLFTEPALTPASEGKARIADTDIIYNTNDNNYESVSQLISDAKHAGGEWAVIYGVINACFIQSDSDDEIHYLVQIDSIEICDHSLTDFDEYDFSSGLSARIDLNDKIKQDNFHNTLSSPIFIRMTKNSDSDIQWKIDDYKLEK